MNKIKATYVSVWDGGVEIRTSCLYWQNVYGEAVSNNISDIDAVYVDGLDICEDEYVELPDGSQIKSFYNTDDDVFVGDVVCPDCDSDNIIIDTGNDPDSWGWCCNENKPIYDFPKIK